MRRISLLLTFLLAAFAEALKRELIASEDEAPSERMRSAALAD